MSYVNVSRRGHEPPTKERGTARREKQTKYRDHGVFHGVTLLICRVLMARKPNRMQSTSIIWIATAADCRGRWTYLSRQRHTQNMTQHSKNTLTIALYTSTAVLVFSRYTEVFLLCRKQNTSRAAGLTKYCCTYCAALPDQYE